MKLPDHYHIKKCGVVMVWESCTYLCTRVIALFGHTYYDLYLRTWSQPSFNRLCIKTGNWVVGLIVGISDCVCLFNLVIRVKLIVIHRGQAHHDYLCVHVVNGYMITDRPSGKPPVLQEHHVAIQGSTFLGAQGHMPLDFAVGP